MDNEADKIYKEVKKRKRRAEELGLHKLVGDLYSNQIKYYPSWIKNNRDYVCSLVSDATSLDKNTIKITFNNRIYSFKFEDHIIHVPDDSVIHGKLELFLNDKKMLVVNMSLEHKNYDAYWSAFSVEAFIDGDWIKDFQAMKKRIEEQAKEREKRKKEDPEKLKKLKEDFGIE